MKRAWNIVAGLALALSVQAAERGTPAEAKAMLDKAAAHYKAVGRKQALADFNAKQGPFADRDLYVFCIGPDRKLTANGAYRMYVGQPVDVLKDANGKPLGQALLDAAGSGGSVEYPLGNPVTRKTEMKVSYVRKLGEDVCGVGAFKG